MNKIIFCGRITRDLEIRYTSSQMAVARFGFAVNRRYKKEGQPEADFFNCIAYGKVVDTLTKCNVGKGTKLLLECEARNNNWTDAEGKKHYDIDFIVNSFEFCESKGSGQSGAGSVPPPPPSRTMETGEQSFAEIDDLEEEEDLPF